MINPHVAVLVLNRNMREMTEALIARIHETSRGVRHTIFGLDAASERDQIARRGVDVLVEYHENRRWAHSFADGMSVALRAGVPYRIPSVLEAISDDGVQFRNYDDRHNFTHFWLLCNDTQLDPSANTLEILLRSMPEDACQIHPFQRTHQENTPQGRHRGGAKVTSVAFVEFVCPLITRKFYDACHATFGVPPVNPAFAYGWGVDYEMAYFGHALGMKNYICNEVGITHHPGTTHENHEKTKVEDNVTMRRLARNNMLDVLEARYGRDWGTKFADQARAVGIDPAAFLGWSAYDRGLALTGGRV